MLGTQMGEPALHIMGCDFLKTIFKRGELKLTSADELFKSAQVQVIPPTQLQTVWNVAIDTHFETAATHDFDGNRSAFRSLHFRVDQNERDHDPPTVLKYPQSSFC